MANLLGDVWLAQGRSALDVRALGTHPDVLELVLYGKEGAKARRKMGHLVAHGPSPEAARDAALAARRSLARPVGG
jgi:5-(carboxyamino)imidazole ribonucleotide synthase